MIIFTKIAKCSINIGIFSRPKDAGCTISTIIKVMTRAPARVSTRYEGKHPDRVFSNLRERSGA
jgi:hypothetical protein